jgi:lipopolysaccharide export LptBFGC system permease protein LptF
MLIDILISLVMSLVMYIVVNTITSASQQKTEQYFKDQLDKQTDTVKTMFQQLQTNFMNEVHSNKTDILSEIKESSEKKG